MYLSKLTQLIIALLVLSTFNNTQAKSKNGAPPSRTHIINILFANLDKTYHLNSMEEPGLNCKPKTVNCLLQSVLAALTDGSYTKENKKEGKKWAPHGWSKTHCKLHQRTDHLKYINNNPLYKPSFTPVLKKLKDKEFWECTIAWGVANGSNHWHQELRFSLKIITKTLIPHSFAAINTP
ncbi:hypothetical protein MNBD_GAMMA12-646 [hydrothermal vent metagenome]|uniref:Uncharacterized protein n=1 Tax=hydrothermal vent metagenome TaxID=652676 RepID=A0A3B0YKP5_9ZZZZ